MPRGLTVWLTGLPAAGKTTIGDAVAEGLGEAGYATYRLDGDVLRRTLSADLGFDAASRQENIRRAANLARILADAGLIVVVSLISPYRASREEARAMHASAGLPFLLVYLDTPLAECERRDPRGLYARARRGEITDFTGVDGSYEAPAAADVTLHTEAQSIEESRRQVIDAALALDLTGALKCSPTPRS